MRITNAEMGMDTSVLSNMVSQTGYSRGHIVHLWLHFLTVHLASYYDAESGELLSEHIEMNPTMAFMNGRWNPQMVIVVIHNDQTL